LTILDRWTHAYGGDYSTLPELDRRAAELRHLLTDKQALIVLDDVQSRDEIQPFLVGGPRCIILLTTRNRSVAVDVSEYKNIRSLGALTPAESRQLMAQILGERRVARERERADQICQLLGHLPLAVEITAKKLAIDPAMSLADMLAWLYSEKNQAQTLHLLDPEVRASFAVSWHVLDEEMRWTFSLLAVFGGRTITAAAFAAVTQMEKWPAQSRLTAFVALSLLTGEGQGRYRQHPLLVEFALEKLAERTAHRPQDREEAYARMVRYYLAYAAEHRQDYDQLEQEWDNLAAAMQEAVDRQMWPEVIDFAGALTEVWFAWGHFSEARQAYGWACEAARALDDRPVLAANLQRWGRACIEQGDYNQAQDLLSLSIEIYQELDDPFGVASTQSYLGRLFYDKADYDAAQQVLAEAQSTLVEEGDHEYTARVLYLQAMIRYDHDQLEAAQLLAETALELQQPLDDKAGAMRTLTLLAEVAGDRDDYDLAIEKCEAALELGKQIQDKTETAATLYTLCKVLRRKGDAHSALERGRVSLAWSKQLGDRRGQAQTLSLLSEIHLDLGEPGTALSLAQQSLELCYELEDLWGAVWVLRNIGDAYQALDQRPESHEAWSKALELATGRSHPLTQSLIDRLGP
jgi:tetratricopeptide (TPR) repeat protein